MEWPDLLAGIQSALAPAGPHARAVAGISWAMFIGGGLILGIVIVMSLIALFAPRPIQKMIGNSRTVIAGGIIFPIVTLTALLAFGLSQNQALTSGETPRLRIEVIGEMWWWRTNYLDASGELALSTANEIRIPVGVPVEFRLKSADVIHSFWVPALAGKLDMIPGRVNSYVFSADEPGTYRGQCAEYCGAQHANMAFYVVALSQEDFEHWYAAQSQPAPDPTTTQQAHGLAVFEEAGCGACHTIRGTSANGELGPDLTHVGGRVSLGAGMFANNTGTLAGWIASAQHLKPENKMPSFGTLDGPDLRAIAAYLESLQ